MVSEKNLGFDFGKFGLGKKVSVSVLEKFGLNSTINHNKKKHITFNPIVFVIVRYLSERKFPYLNAFAECLLINNVV